MISKKLLCEVLEQEVEEFEILGIDDIHIIYTIDEYDIISIYKLAHKCKEWANSKNLPILSVVGKTTYSVFDRPSMPNVFYGDTEPEAIFKACQWILDSKEK